MEYKIKYILGFLVILVFIAKLNCQVIFPEDDDDGEIEEDITDIESRVTSIYGKCVTPNRRRGSCVKLRDCRNIWNLIQNKKTFELSSSELDFMRKSKCGENSEGVLVCCTRSEIVFEAVSPKQPVSNKPATQFQRKSNTNLLPNSKQCISLANKILGGVETSLGEFPWMVLLQYTKTRDPPGFHCGGSLINNRYVITAAHCIKRISKDWRLSAVRLGEHDTKSNPDCVQNINNNVECADEHLDIPVEKYIVHEDYSAGSKAQLHDIALLRLSRPVQFTRYIRPICLPTSNNLQNRNFTGISLEVAGWGQTENRVPSDKKLKAEVRGVSLAACNNRYASMKVTLQESQICAGGVRGIDSCNGDSGGPLMDIDHSARPSSYYLAGLVSFGPSPCGLEGWPGIYTKISPYMTWIQQNLEP